MSSNSDWDWNALAVINWDWNALAANLNVTLDQHYSEINWDWNALAAGPRKLMMKVTSYLMAVT
jgi:hypothetical protein